MDSAQGQCLGGDGWCPGLSWAGGQSTYTSPLQHACRAPRESVPRDPGGSCSSSCDLVLEFPDYHCHTLLIKQVTKGIPAAGDEN